MVSFEWNLATSRLDVVGVIGLIRRVHIRSTGSNDGNAGNYVFWNKCVGWSPRGNRCGV